MALHLDSRQRAMLLEMGVRVWLPGTAFETTPPTLTPADAPARPARSGLAAQAAVGAAGRAADTTAQAAARAAPAVLPRAAPLPVRAAPQPNGAAQAPAHALPALATLDWPALAAASADCRACSLCAGRQHSTLAALASLQADWMVVGDPPDLAEDSAAQPFVGDEGVLLANMLKAVGVRRGGQGAQGAYATNVVKCRPPHGRNPQPDDLAQCAAYLEREIALVQPKVILALGRFAMATLLREHGTLASQPLGKLRGTVYGFGGIPVVVSYHPKLLLRNSADKAKAWADLCLALDCVGAS